jgi:hypothetical protein
MSCRCAAIHAAGFSRRLGQITADSGSLIVFFYPQISQIFADFGGMIGLIRPMLFT